MSACMGVQLLRQAFRKINYDGTDAEVKVRMLANERRGKKVFHSVSDDGTSYE